MEQVRKVEGVLRRWDPIGVLPGECAPADEYDAYAPQIVSLIQRGGSMDQLLAHLSHLRTETMGMPPNSELDKEAAEEIVRAITGSV
jgi:hypothetical protein